MTSDEGLLHRAGEYVREHRRGMVGDLVFAVVWVTFVNVVFQVVDGPTWAYYTLLFAGVLAYFGVVYSIELAARTRA